MTASWTLSGRMLSWFTALVVGTVVLVAVPGAWFVWKSADREIAALLREELDEMQAAFPHTDRSPAAFRELGARYRSHHPAIPLAWRLWDESGTRMLAESGEVSLFEPGVPDPSVLDQTRTVDRDRKWRSARLASGHIAGLVIDGEPQLALLRHYGQISALLLLVGAGSAIALSTILCRRISRMLLEIADRARSVRTPDQSVELASERLPEEIRVVAEALQEMLGNIQAGIERSRLMTAGMAHELRSPIQNLIGETEVALLSKAEPDELRTLLGSHLEELRALGDVVDNLMTLCHASMDREVPEVHEEFDLAREAQIRLAREKGQASRRGIDVDIRHRGDTRMRGDREAFLRALRNLTANAVEWTPAGGEVHIEIEGLDEGIVITVDDGGPGVPEELRDRIFQPFFRGPAHEGRRAGYGLGLAIVQTALSAQGGRIEVERSPLGGARFRLLIPRDGPGGVTAPRGAADGSVTVLSSNEIAGPRTS